MKSEPPWSDDEVESLNAYQADGRVHPFTSEDGNALIATSTGWVEAIGGPIIQTWAHSWMVDWSWKKNLAGWDPSPTLPKTFA